MAMLGRRQNSQQDGAVSNESNHLSGTTGGDVLTTPRRGRIRSCWWSVLGCCNTVGIFGVGAVVVFLFIQTQYLSFKVQQEQKEIEDLKQQVQNRTAGQIQQLSEQVEQQKDYTIYQLAGTFTLLTCLLTMFHMASHLRNLHEPFVQRKILAILWMSPIYSVTSFLSLLLPSTEGYLSIIKDLYEAYVIYTFLSFLIAVMGRGDRDVVVQQLARHADHLDNPAKFLRRFYEPPPEVSSEAKANAVLLECQILAMQFVFLRPLTSIMSFLVFTLSNDNDNDGITEGGSSAGNYFLSPNFYISMITNVSVFFAFSGLLKFYHVVRDDLKWLQPFNKFLAIKGIVFLTFWQGLAISIAVQFGSGGINSEAGNVEDGDENSSVSPVKDPRAQAVAIQNLLICLEMLFFSLAHWCVFPTEEWEPDYRPKTLAKPGLGFSDFAKDVKVIMRRGKHKGSVPVPQEPMSLQSSTDDLDSGALSQSDEDENKII